jgi:broad specificity phosphatase PhoE
MRIYLVRHGESEGNVDKNVHNIKPDHALNLTSKGEEQALAAGNFLNTVLREDYNHQIRGLDYAYRYEQLARCDKPRLWTSPYNRTRQTSDGLLKAGIPIESRREHIALVEQQFGLFDGVSDEDLPIMFPAEHEHYKKSADFEGRFWARMPLGESRFDVSLRVHQAFGTFQRDLKHGVEDLIIVTHGVVIRAFVMMWCHKEWEWFENEPNPKNCSIRMLDGSEDKGYIYTGETPTIESRTETI